MAFAIESRKRGSSDGSRDGDAMHDTDRAALSAATHLGRVELKAPTHAA